VKYIKLKRTHIVCTREKEREKERKNREKTKFFIIFLKKNELPPKNKNKKNTLFVGHRVRVPYCPVNRGRI
jgi:hypothetical protein